jgi:xanthine dehydrogenase molybdopterin-binding subunit B
MRILVTKVPYTMNAPFDPALFLTEKFAVGQPVSRKEDPVLLRGEGRYSDDLNRTGQLYGVMVRSRIAHGTIRSIDTEAAREMPGVRAVITSADLDAARIKNMPAAAGKHRDGSPAPRPPQRPLATGRVRYVGEPIDDLRAVGNEAGMTMATMAVSWVLSNPATTAPIIGASRPEQLADSLAAAEKGALPEDLKARLDDITRGWRAVDAAR